MGYRKLFWVGNVLMLLVFVWALAADNDAEWKKYQRSYYRLTAAKPLARFSWTAAQRQRRQQGHYGPWHQVEGG